MIEARVIQVIEVKGELLGNGTEENPARRATEYFTLEGVSLAKVDPWKKEQEEK